MTREDIECIKWFSHIEQLATDGKTANGFQIPTDRLLTTIKVVAKDSREYVEKFFNESIPKGLEEAAEISFDEAKSLTEDYRDFLAKGLTENKPRPIGPHWFCEYAKNRFIAGARWQEEQDRETIELAEDHAYFAGKEKLREELLEWAKSMKTLCEEHPGYKRGGWHDGCANSFKKLIDKLNSI